MKSKIVIGIVAVALLMVLMVSTARACVGPGLSPGFWKHNVGVYLSGGDNYSDPGVTGPAPSGPLLPPCTKDTMHDWLQAHWTDAQLLALYNDLNTKGGGATGDATRVAAANVFNYMADLFPY